MANLPDLSLLHYFTWSYPYSSLLSLTHIYLFLLSFTLFTTYLSVWALVCMWQTYLTCPYFIILLGPSRTPIY